MAWREMEQEPVEQSPDDIIAEMKRPKTSNELLEEYDEEQELELE